MIRSNHDAGLSIQQRDKPSPTQFIPQTHDRGRSEKCRHRYHHNPGAHVFPAASPVGGVGGVLSKQASLQIGPERLESGRVSLEIGQGRSFEDMNALDRIFQRRSQFPWRITSNYCGQTSVRSRYDPTLQFPEPIFLDA